MTLSHAKNYLLSAPQALRRITALVNTTGVCTMSKRTTGRSRSQVRTEAAVFSTYLSNKQVHLDVFIEQTYDAIKSLEWYYGRVANIPAKTEEEKKNLEEITCGTLITEYVSHEP